MTSNPHPEHGPLWVERNIFRSAILARPHALMCGDALVGSLYPHQADAVEAQLTPLPDGVYRCQNVHLLQSGFPVPGGWVRKNLPEDRGPRRTPSAVCRITAEPPAPPTEDVPLHELCGRRLPGCDWEVRSFAYGNGVYNTPAPELSDKCAEFDLNPDGTVTVQAQAVQP